MEKALSYKLIALQQFIIFCIHIPALKLSALISFSFGIIFLPIIYYKKYINNFIIFLLGCAEDLICYNEFFYTGLAYVLLQLLIQKNSKEKIHTLTRIFRFAIIIFSFYVFKTIFMSFMHYEELYLYEICLFGIYGAMAYVLLQLLLIKKFTAYYST